MKFGNSRAKLAVCLLVCVGLFACGPDKKNRATVKITNGRVIPLDYYREVVQLRDGLGGLCTGTFIGPDTVLTAAHCTQGGRTVTRDGSEQLAGSVELIVVTAPPRLGIKVLAVATSVVLHPQWAEEYNKQNVNNYDLALVKFAPNTSGYYALLASAAPMRGDDLVIVGFGLNYMPAPGDDVDISSADVKRVGTNKVSAVQDGFISFQGTSMTGSADGSHANAASGDSGGPLFIGGRLAGVTSSGGRSSDGFSTSYYVDLQSSSSWKFLNDNGFGWRD